MAAAAAAATATRASSRTTSLKPGGPLPLLRASLLLVSPTALFPLRLSQKNKALSEGLLPLAALLCLRLKSCNSGEAPGEAPRQAGGALLLAIQREEPLGLGFKRWGTNISPSPHE